MPSHLYDIAIVGAGTAGLAALREARRHTDNLVIVNDGPYGTTCARVGCMPSKALIESANAFHRRAAFASLGIEGAASLNIDPSAVLARVRRLRDRFTNDISAITSALGDQSIAGRARFAASDTLDIDGRRIKAKKIIVATGSRPIVPPEWHSFGPRVLTTDTLFEQTSLPRQIGVIGLGAVGTELAQALARLGLQVSAFGSNRFVAGLSDERVNDTLVDLLRKEFAVNLGERAQLEHGEDGRIRVIASGASTTVDCVLATLGRRPNVDALGLEELGVELDAEGVPIFNHATRQIGQLPIYIAGDAANENLVLHEAADDGYIAGTNATLDQPICFERRTPLFVAFTEPNVAVIGTPYARLDPATTAIGAVSFTTQGRATLAEENRGIARVYASRADSRLTGAELCAPRGEHLAHLLGLAISRRLTVHDALRMPFYHPVFEEGLRTALRDLSKQLGHERQSDLSSCRAVGASALD